MYVVGCHDNPERQNKGKKMKMSLLDIAVKKSGELLDSDSSEKRTLVVVGSKGVGKTTMLQRFLEKNDPIKETLALEYSFARKSGRSLNKEICHIWELGGGTVFASLLPTVFGPNAHETTLVVMLDLSAPKTLWVTLEVLLETVFNFLSKTGQKYPDRVPADHEDASTLSPFPVPLVLIGGKYDLFQNFDPEEKKIICRSLRLVAHSLAGSLFFYSDHDQNLVKKSKDLLNHYGFGGAPWKGYSVDINKPLCVPFGSDSYEQIAAKITPNLQMSGLSLERFKHAFTSQFPQELEKYVIPDDPAKDPNFKEPSIDQLRNLKNEELDRFLQEMENRRKLSEIK